MRFSRLLPAPYLCIGLYVLSGLIIIIIVYFLSRMFLECPLNVP
jgi:hypothetical protein